MYCTVLYFPTALTYLKMQCHRFKPFLVFSCLQSWHFSNRPPGVAIMCKFAFPVYFWFLPESWKPLSQTAQWKHPRFMAPHWQGRAYFQCTLHLWVWLTSAWTKPTCQSRLHNKLVGVATKKTVSVHFWRRIQWFLDVGPYLLSGTNQIKGGRQAHSNCHI